MTDTRRAARFDYLAAAGVVAFTTVLGMLGRTHLMLPDLVALYLLAITISATVFGRGPSLLAATLSVLAYDFFFIPPVFTFAVTDLHHIVTFIVMFVVGVLISGLTLRVRRHELEARMREERTAALYALSQDLSAAVDESEAAVLFSRRAKQTFHTDAAVFITDGKGDLIFSGASVPDRADVEAQRRIVEEAFGRGLLLSVRSADSPEGGHYVPLRAGPILVGALAFSPPLITASIQQTRFLEAFAQQGALALQRVRLTREAEGAALRARTEEMRSALLSTVSHDLRTPLAAITGAASTLRDDRLPSNTGERAELLDMICEEADRMERLVRNLLDMTQLQSGALQVRRDWVPLEEIVGSALTRLDAKLVGRRVRTDLPVDLPLLSVDAVLIEQVFVNLLENAAKYTPAESTIEIEARVERDRLVMTVGDSGPGLPPGTEMRVFEKFFRAGGPGIPGAGLGLAICRGVIEAHGGTIAATNRTIGGALFILSLPLSENPPSVPVELDAQRVEEIP
jgi:two-component system sensor histidine kinase KdpD